MKELGEALKAILDKLGVFLDLFDLSFFISGATAMAAVAFGCFQTGHWPKELPPNWLLVTMIIIATYVAGMVCFALGRFVRQRISKIAGVEMRSEQLKVLLELHGLDQQEPNKSYLARPDSTAKVPMNSAIWALQTRIWAGLRHDPALAPSLSLLNRYWVMAATYDGLSMALLGWGLLLGSLCLYHATTILAVHWWQAGGCLAGGVICAAICLNEATRYTVHQLGELTATLAAEQKRP